MSGPIKTHGKLLRVERAKRRSGCGNRGASVDYIYECLQCGSVFASKSKKAKFCGLVCSRDYYTSKPRKRVCVECGREFSVMITDGGNYSDRKTCSDKCAEMQRRCHIDYGSKERSIKLSDAAKRNNSVAALHTPESRKKAGPAIGDAKAWVDRTGASARGVSRSKCVVCLVSPSGDLYETDCIRQFVRDHAELFDIADLARRKSCQKLRTTIEGNMTCRAMCGLAEVARGAKRSWKGWVCFHANTSAESRAPSARTPPAPCSALHSTSEHS